MLKTNLENLQSIAKERTVRTQSIEYDLETLVKKIKKKTIKLDPDYQRRHRWSTDTSSRLIESLILNIPIPTIYLSYDVDVDQEALDDEARYSVIDGQQRLTAILNFFENKYSLEGLDILEALEGCFYKDLPPFLLRRLEERTVKCLRIDSTVDPQVKYDIFERLNSGSVALGSHELRNAVLRGPFNNLCKKLAKNEDFRILNQISITNPDTNAKVKKMEDVELVLRFFSLIEDNYKTYKKSKDNNFKDFLSEKLEDKNKLDKVAIEDYSSLFINTMKFIRAHFGDTAFAKYKVMHGEYILQSRFNAAVYDALSVAVATEVITKNKQIPKSKKISEKFLGLFADDKFHDSVSGSILDSTKIVHRIDAAKKIFK
ncbi:TPA: DUF262 domain-containing protein [Elizabethkingia anophelis]